MNGPYYIISDNHFSMILNSPEKRRREKLFKVFNKIKKIGEGSLIIGGDFFDYWFEYKYDIPKGYEDILKSLRDLNDNNINIYYILGNHDYWDFGYLNRMTGAKTYKKDLEFRYNNMNVLITHGDGLLRSEYTYRFMRSIIRSKLFIKLYKLFPSELTCKIVKKISQVSAHYNHNDKFIKEIKHDTLKYAKDRWSKNYDIICIGHYHQTGIIENEDKKLIYLGDWISKFTVTVINNKTCWQGDWKQFIELS